MPNTLAHVGIQGITTRNLLKGADYKWIYIGCIIPDLPWIIRWIIQFALPTIDPYDLRLYCIIQSAFCFCLLFSLAFATLSDKYWKTFTILASNSFLHLLLDACQTKWANGVHFLTPFNWGLINFGFFWPESLPTYLLTIFGLGYLVWNWRRAVVIPITITWHPATRLCALITLTTAYFTLPFFLIDVPEEADNHFVKTLRNRSDRSGQHVEFDRRPYTHQKTDDILRTFAGEELRVSGMKLDFSGTASVKGSFVTEDKINVSQYHIHSKGIRDGSSYLGLFLVSVLWVCAFFRQLFWKGDLQTSSE